MTSDRYTYADWLHEEQERASMREESEPGGHTNGQTGGRWHLLSDAELEEQPPRQDVIQSILPVAAFAPIVGPPASAKSTLAIDLACTLATGLDWHGRPVLRGPVVFVAAEGSHGLGARLRAWKRAREWQGPAGVYFLPHAVNLMQPAEVDAFLKSINHTLSAAPALIVLDTLARCMCSGDENSARDMGLWIAGADRLRTQTGAGLVPIHHTTKAGTLERGSSALRGAADVLLLVEREDDVITITCDKAKDSTPFAPLRFALNVIYVDPVVSACVLTLDTDRSHRRPVQLPETRRRALEALRDVDHGEGATPAEWQRASGLVERTFHRAVKDLVAWELVSKTGSRRTVRYTTIRSPGETHV